MNGHNFKIFADQLKETYHTGCDILCEEMEQGNDPIGDYFDKLGKIGLMVIGMASLLVAVIILLAVI